LDKIFQIDYDPTFDDMLRSRMRTAGVTSSSFDYNGGHFDIYDAGGQRSERKKWINAFDGVTAVLYVAGLDHYATVLFEDEETNAMIESLHLFYDILNVKWFARTAIILFLNKEDLFDECIKADIPLSCCFNAENQCINNSLILNDDRSINNNNSNKNSNSNHISYISCRESLDFILFPNSSITDDVYDIDRREGDKKGIPDFVIQTASRARGDTSPRSSKSAPNSNLIKHEKNHKNNVNNHTISPNSKSDENRNFNYNSKDFTQECEIYPNVDLRYSTKETYCNGEHKNMSDDEWFTFVKNEYLAFIVKEYKSKNHMPKRHIYVHKTTATEEEKVTKLLLDVQMILIRNNLTGGGII